MHQFHNKINTKYRDRKRIYYRRSLYLWNLPFAATPLKLLAQIYTNTTQANTYTTTNNVYTKKRHLNLHERMWVHSHSYGHLTEQYARYIWIYSIVEIKRKDHCVAVRLAMHRVPALYITVPYVQPALGATLCRWLEWVASSASSRPIACAPRHT